MTTPGPVIFVVDDDASFRSAVTRLLRAGGYTVETFTSAAEFLEAPNKTQTGCVVVDLHMPGPSGLDLQDALVKADSSLPVIFLTGHGDFPSSVRAIKQGAEDFLTKPVKKEMLFAAIRRALARQAEQSQQRTRQRELRARTDSLTPRKAEVLDHVLCGELNKQIAGSLGTSERTIKAHRANIMDKLQVQSVAELVQLAREAGFSGRNR
jgi:FixJ family two-component response regulator